MTISINARKRMEKTIARRVILDAIAAGYTLNVYNGGETDELPEPSNKVRTILGAMFGTDEEHLIFFKEGKRKGWVWFVYGNDGWDVVSDYTTNLEDVMKGANDLADKYSG